MSEPMYLNCTGESLFLLSVSCCSELRPARAPVVKAGINLHCSMQIQGSTRQHLDSVWSSSEVHVLSLTLALHWGKKSFLSDGLVGDLPLAAHMVYCEQNTILNKVMEIKEDGDRGWVNKHWGAGYLQEILSLVTEKCKVTRAKCY